MSDDNDLDDDNDAPKPKKKKAARKSGGKTAKTASTAAPQTLGWRIVTNLAAAGVWAAIAGLIVIAYLALTLPPIDVNTLTRRPNVVILDDAGAELASFGDNYGRSVSLKDLPKHLPAAVVSVEDRRFYDHFGIDVRGLARAMFVNAQAQGMVQGGSTITQQVAKNLFLTPERTLSRKLREMMLALWLEQNFSKDEILTIYLNRVYLGAGTYGVEAAAQRYFDKSAKDLGVYQSAVIAGLLKAPSRYNPAADPALAQKRAEIVLQTMVETGALTDAQAKAAQKSGAQILKTASANSKPQRARYFADWILTQVESYVGTVDRDLVVKTTLNWPMQQAAEAILDKQIEAAEKSQKVTQGAILTLAPNGAVRVMVGGRDYGDSQFNRVTQAQRQPGSSFKPFVYLAALNAGYKPDDMVTDAPINISGWKPKNFSGDYKGPVTVEYALQESINTVAVRLAQDVGAKTVVNTAHRLGITSDLKPELSLALGSNEVTLLELTTAYVPFANSGYAVFPFAIVSIADRDGTVLYQRQANDLGRVISEENVAVMNRLMNNVIMHGTGKAANFGFPAAGKTGTSSDFRDALFVGYTADLITGVWVGNDDGKFMKGVTGGGLPARIWHDVMLAAHKGYERKELPGLEDERGLIARFWESIVGDEKVPEPTSTDD
jgi:penicillin-binding protein 1A